MVYRVCRIVFRVIAWPLFRFRVRGVARVPRDGPAVIVAPHRSWLDPACVGAACPRPVRFLMMDRVYRKRSARWFYRTMRAIPVRVGGGPLTLRAMRRALRALGNGEVIAVFPEGRVFSDAAPGPLHPGAALLAVRSGAPVIPMVIRGSAEAWPHGRSWPGPARVQVLVGEPIVPPAGGGREAVGPLLVRIETAFHRLAQELERA